MAHQGRRLLLDDEMSKSICKEIRAGQTFEDAALLSGITPWTIFNWMKKGKLGEEPYAQFAVDVAAARVQSKADAIKAVRAGLMQNGTPDWKAEAWFLERTFPDQYGPQTAVHVKVEKELERVLDALKNKLSTEVYDQVLAAISEPEDEDNDK